MEKNILLQIITTKINCGWDFEKIYNHLLIIDDLQKEYKGVVISDNNTLNKKQF